MNPTDEITHGRTATKRRGARSERTFPGRLVAITATGPIYEAPVTCTLLPISCVLALHQELAARTINRHARVVSSLANRVHGDRAYSTWSAQTLGFSTALSQASPAARIAILGEVLRYIHARRSADGLESVAAAAVNAAWPWLAPQQLEATLHFVQPVLHRATFTDKVATPVVDPNLRTVSAIAAGRFKKIDVIEWLNWYKLDIPNWQLGGVRTPQLPGKNDPSPSDLLHGGPGDRTPGAPGSPWGNLGALPGSSGHADGSARGSDLLHDGPGDRTPGAPGNPWGNLGALPGSSGHADGSAPGSDLLHDGPADRTPGAPGNPWGNLGALPGLGGSNGASRGGDGPSVYRGPFSDGALDNIGKDGGPLGFGSSLGMAGAASWESSALKVAGVVVIAGGAYTAVGGAVVGVVGTGAAGGAGTAAGSGIVALGVGVMYGGWKLIEQGQRLDDKEEQKQAKTQADKKAADDKNAEDAKNAEDEKKKEERPIPVKKLPDATVTPAQLPDAPKNHDDVYPDPDHHAGGSVPDDWGTGGGPNTVPDDWGTGGGPNTDWDENGGGGTPTTVGVSVRRVALVGDGLRAGLVQISANSFSY